MTNLHQLYTEALPWLHAHGYTALAVAVAIEGAGIPAPGGLLMSGAAILAGKGEMNLAAVLATAWTAALVGDNLGYLIGRWGGRRLLLRAGVSRRRLGLLEGCFRRWGAGLILIGRFFDGTRQLDGLLAGSARMPWGRFLIADLSGCALWVGIWVIGLYALDWHGGALHRLLLYLNPWVAGLAVTAGAALLWWLLRRDRTAEATATPKNNDTTGRNSP